MQQRISIATIIALAGSVSVNVRGQQPEWVPSPAASSWIYELAELETFEGTHLYASGWFDSIGETKASGIARWDGSVWSAMGKGIFGQIRALATFDRGDGQTVYAGSIDAGVHRWDGNSWSVVGSNGGLVKTLVLRTFTPEGATHSQLIAGGTFGFTGGTGIGIARLDGETWQIIGGGMSGYSGYVYDLAEFEVEGETLLVAGGHFANAGGVPCNRVAAWNGRLWMPLGEGLGVNSSPYVSALAVFDEDGEGPKPPALFAGGNFTTLGNGTPMLSIARWDGVEWSAVAGGADGAVYDFAVGTLHGEHSLVPTGLFTHAGGIEANLVARWNGTAWSAFGDGLVKGTSDPTHNGGFAAAIYGGSQGAELLVGGVLAGSGGVQVQNLARWAPREAVCWGDCTGEGTLSINDFVCFQTKFILGDGGADCDGDHQLTVDD
jgi:hypothetical protein